MVKLNMIVTKKSQVGEIQIMLIFKASYFRMQILLSSVSVFFMFFFTQEKHKNYRN